MPLFRYETVLTFKLPRRIIVTKLAIEELGLSNYEQLLVPDIRRKYFHFFVVRVVFWECVYSVN